ncbi:hypothetical protein K438DRAFT_89657 [Mycena galopus ATCC 62051]|nr:hypothetical protein K438DRAFT_89657 [Mycena galopus ATCC 62051]
MWRSATLGNLLACLPPDLCAVSKADSKYSMRLLREFRKEDWDRPSIYAARVKYLFSGSDGWSLEDILPHLCPPKIFPVLQGLVWNHASDQFLFIETFLSPAITTISFPSSSESLSFLPTLASKYPQLKHTTISLDQNSSASWDSLEELCAISSFLCELSDVESISVPQLNSSAMAHISRLPNLTSLTVDIFPHNWTAPAVDNEQGFASLEQLTLSYSSVAESITFMEWLNQIPLFDLSIHFSTAADSSQIHALFSALSTGISHPCLSELWIHSEYTDLEESATYRVENRSFRLLFSFVNLVSVSIQVGGGFDIDDATILELSRAWPLIETLELIEGNRFPETRLTLSCLFSFAANCPRLTTLKMTFNSTAIPYTAHTLAHGLKSLLVCHSPMSVPAIVPVAQFLSGCFPALKWLEAARTPLADDVDEEERMERAEAEESKRCWKEVGVLVCRGRTYKS